MKKIKKPNDATPATIEVAAPIEQAAEPLVSGNKGARFANLTRPTADFTKSLAAEIVKNLAQLKQMTAIRFPQRAPKVEKKPTYEYPCLLDTSILIDGRIVPVVNSGFLSGTLLIPQFVLGEVQHIADSADLLRRTKGRRGLDVAGKLRGQKANDYAKVKIITEDPADVKEVDHKLVALAKKYKWRLMTVDFNLGQLARAQGVKVLNVNDLAQAIKVAITAGEELQVKITHEGKERMQGVGYLADGTMIVVDDARTRVGEELLVVITKVHQTAAGQLFFAKIK